MNIYKYLLVVNSFLWEGVIRITHVGVSVEGKSTSLRSQSSWSKQPLRWGTGRIGEDEKDRVRECGSGQQLRGKRKAAS